MTTGTQDQALDLAPAVRGQIGETQAGTMSAVARAEAEIKAAIVIAKQFPRNEAQAHLKIMKSCDRPGFADEAMYSFPRGGQSVEGPSVTLARELARCMGNIRFGLRVVTEDEDRIHICGYAYDAETNTMIEMEDKFSKLIQRKDRQTGVTRWVKPDERDLRELMNRRGAICVRNAILQLVPRDFVEDAVSRCKKTLVDAAKGQMRQDPKATVRQMVEKFDQLRVTVEMLERFLGHGVDLTTPEEFAKLRGIWQSIADGNSRRDEHFDAAPAAAQPPATATVDVAAVVKPSSTPVAPRASVSDSLKPTAQAASPINLNPARTPGEEG